MENDGVVGSADWIAPPYWCFGFARASMDSDAWCIAPTQTLPSGITSAAAARCVFGTQAGLRRWGSAGSAPAQQGSPEGVGGGMRDTAGHAHRYNVYPTVASCRTPAATPINLGGHHITRPNTGTRISRMVKGTPLTKHTSARRPSPGFPLPSFRPTFPPRHASPPPARTEAPFQQRCSILRENGAEPSGFELEMGCDTPVLDATSVVWIAGRKADSIDETSKCAPSAP